MRTNRSGLCGSQLTNDLNLVGICIHARIVFRFSFLNARLFVVQKLRSGSHPLFVNRIDIIFAHKLLNRRDNSDRICLNNSYKEALCLGVDMP